MVISSCKDSVKKKLVGIELEIACSDIMEIHDLPLYIDSRLKRLI